MKKGSCLLTFLHLKLWGFAFVAFIAFIEFDGFVGFIGFIGFVEFAF